jgi:hypothetical protein
MTINLGETYNFVLKATRVLQLTTIVQDISHGTVKYISERDARELRCI